MRQSHNYRLTRRRFIQGERTFTSQAVERALQAVKGQSGDKERACLFEHCLPNTLSTTVDFKLINGQPNDYVMTGDLDAMQLHDLRDNTMRLRYLPGRHFVDE